MLAYADQKDTVPSQRLAHAKGGGGTASLPYREGATDGITQRDRGGYVVTEGNSAKVTL